MTAAAAWRWMLVLAAGLPACPSPPAPGVRDAGRTAPRASGSAASRAPSGPPIAVGGAATGELTATDEALPAGPVADAYRVTLTAGQQVTVIARGGPSNSVPGQLLDVSCEILRGGVVLAGDDNSASTAEGARNCRILFSAPANDTYVVRVRTPGPARELGPYNVQVYPGHLPGQG